MKNATAILALAAMLSAGATGIAAAKPIHDHGAQTRIEYGSHRDSHRETRHSRYRILSEREVVRSLYRQGYRDIRNVRLVRADYVLIARGYRGTVRLVVDGRTGRVMSRDLVRHQQPRPGFRIQGGNGNFNYSFGIR